MLSILMIVFKGVRMSCEVEATIISESFAIDLVYSFWIISVISFKIIISLGSS